MSRFGGFAVLLLLCTLSSAGAQQPAARLRIMQLSYLPQISATVDVLIDGVTVAEALSFPFATDYLEFATGSYQLTTAIPGHDDASAATEVQLAAGHDYTVIVSGEYTDRVTFTTIDEYEVPLDETGSVAVVVNLSTTPIRDLYLGSSLGAALIAPGEHQFIVLPESAFEVEGRFGDERYTETFMPLSNAIQLIVLLDGPNIIRHRSSSLTVAEYLRDIGPDAQFSSAAAIAAGAALGNAVAGEGEFTLFLPTNDVLAGVANADSFRKHAEYHAVTASISPLQLPAQETLTSLADAAVSLEFSDTPSGYWEIADIPILWDIRLANGVIYAIDGVIVSGP